MPRQGNERQWQGGEATWRKNRIKLNTDIISLISIISCKNSFIKIFFNLTQTSFALKINFYLKIRYYFD